MHERPVLYLENILLPGEHNIENYMAAIGALDGLVPDQVVRDFAAKFAGVDHRIELVRTRNGVRYYNDSIASSPSRTIAGLRSFHQKVVLIAGGYDKHIPFDVLGPEVVEHVKALVLTGDTAPKLRQAAELLRDRELDVDLYLLGSTREEVSGAGATVGTWAVQPDFCVAVDVTHGKTPDGPADKAFAIGGGPAIGVGPNMTRWMTNRMLAKAKERQIPYQLEVMSGHTGTNGWEMQISREGVATSVLSLPLKYMHSPIEVLSLADMEQVAALLVAFTEGLGKEAARR